MSPWVVHSASHPACLIAYAEEVGGERTHGNAVMTEWEKQKIRNLLRCADLRMVMILCQPIHTIIRHERTHRAILMAISGGVSDGLEVLHFD